MYSNKMSRFDYKFENGADIRIGYRSPGFRSFSPLDKMHFAKELGMSVIEPQIAAHEINSGIAAEEYKKAADEAGIQIFSTGAMLPHFKEHGIFMQGLETVLEYMRIMNIKYCFTAIRHDYQPYSPEEAWNLLVEETKLAADMFDENKSTYAIEVDKGCFVETQNRAERLIREVDRDNVTVNFDPTNFYLNKQEPLKVFDTFKSGINFGHIKDGIQSAGKEAPVGEGELDYESIFREMVKYPKKYCMFIEHCSKREQVIAAADHIEKILKSLVQIL